MRTTVPARTAAGLRKAEVFNAVFPVGALVAVRRVPGEPATWDRVFAPAYARGDDAMVELASSLIPVDSDIVFAFQPGLADAARPNAEPVHAVPQPTAGWATTRAQLAALLLAFTFGAAVVVLLAVSTEPARIPPARVIYDCTPAAAEPPMTEPHQGAQA